MRLRLAVRIAAVQQTARAAIRLFEVPELQYMLLVVNTTQDEDSDSKTDEQGDEGAAGRGLRVCDEGQTRISGVS